MKGIEKTLSASLCVPTLLKRRIACAATLLALMAVGNLWAQSAAPQPVFAPKVSSYIGVVHPIVTFAGGETTFNFNDFYVVGMTTAIIVRKYEQYAYNLELVAFVRAENGAARTTNLMLHPGVTFFGKKQFSVTPRLGFESSGRFGPSLIFTKQMAKLGAHPLNFNFVNLLRFGNDLPTSYTIAVNITCLF